MVSNVLGQDTLIALPKGVSIRPDDGKGSTKSKGHTALPAAPSSNAKVLVHGPGSERKCLTILLVLAIRAHERW